MERNLFPVFVQTGTLEAVYRHCRAEGTSLTKPTLARMASYFGWKKRRKEAVDQQSAAAPKTGNALADLLIETRLQKEAVCKELKISPAHEGLNRIYGTLIETELKILRDIAREKAAKKTLDAVDQAARSGGLTTETVEKIKKDILGMGK